MTLAATNHKKIGRPILPHETKAGEKLGDYLITVDVEVLLTHHKKSEYATVE